MTDATLARALERAAQALGEDDARSAAAALRDASLACEAALRTGLRIGDGGLGPLRQLHARCCAAADAARQRLGAALGSAVGARRAAAAYRR